MSSESVHPIDGVVAHLEGVRRILSLDVVSAPAHEPVKVTAILPLIGLDRPTFSTFDLDLFFEDNGVKLACPSYMPATAREFIGHTLEANFSQPQPYYTIGMERCKCPPARGGARWSPMCVALKWAPPLQFPVNVTDMTLKWVRLLRTQPEQFCLDGMAILREAGLV